MERQTTFSDFEYANRKRTTKREEFLKTMDEVIPWRELVACIRPHYPSGKRGRPPRGIEPMLRMYLLQVWFNLSDEAVEDSIYDSYAMRSFVGLNFLEEQTPDATTLLATWRAAYAADRSRRLGSLPLRAPSPCRDAPPYMSVDCLRPVWPAFRAMPPTSSGPSAFRINWVDASGRIGWLRKIVPSIRVWTASSRSEARPRWST